MHVRPIGVRIALKWCNALGILCVTDKEGVNADTRGNHAIEPNSECINTLSPDDSGDDVA